MSMPRVRDLITRAYNFVTDIGNKEKKVEKEKSPDSIMAPNTNNSEKQGNIDIYESSGTNFEKYCKRNKIDEGKLSEFVRGSIGINDKMNSSEGEIKKAKQCLEAAYNYLANENGNVDQNELKELAEQYYIAINTGWSIEEFQESQDKTFRINHSVSSAYKKFCLKKLKFGKLFADDISADKEFFKEYIKDCFVDIDKDAIQRLKEQGNNNPTQEDIIAEKKQLQIKIFGRMLANTKKEDRDILMKAVKELYSENRYDAVHTTLSASENKTNAAHLYLEDRHEICNGLNKQETTQMQELGYHYASTEDAKSYSLKDIEYAQECCAKANISPEALMAKAASGSPLTPEEAEALNALGMLPGAQLGIAGNVNDMNHSVLKSYNEALENNNLYERVTQESCSYLEENTKESLIDKKDFVSCMNSSLPKNAKQLTLSNDKISFVKTGCDNNKANEKADNVSSNRSSVTKNAKADLYATTKFDTQKQSKTNIETRTEDTASNPFKSGTPKITQAKNKEHTSQQITAETLIEDLGTIKAVAAAAGNNNYKQSVINDLMTKFEHADIDTKGKMITATSFGGAGSLIRSTSQKERIDLVQEKCVSSTRRSIIEKQYIYNKDTLASSNKSSVA